MQFGVPWMGIAFWIGLFTWLAVGAWAKVQREREKQQTLRSFAERGATLDPQTMERLYPKPHAWPPPEHRRHSPESAARGMAVGGTLMLFVAVGLALGAQILGRIERDALYGMSTGAVVVGSVGLGLIAASFVMRRLRKSARNAESAADDRDR